MKIVRIDDLHDGHFRKAVLKQHGAFLVDGAPCEVEIVGERSAVVRSEGEVDLDELIAEFRFFAEHITEFYDECGALLRRLEPVELFEVDVSAIQPSQFYVSEAKLEAVASFVQSGRDVIVPLNRDGERYISMDGHTRLYLAARMGIERVLGFITETNEDMHEFAREAQRRGVCRPADLQPLPPDEYEEKWIGFCKQFFAAERKDG